MSNFGYVNARLRGQHSRLLGPKDYEELLSLPDLEAMARWMEDSPYAHHWQLAKTRRQGLEAVEEALESNFSSTTSKMLSMAEGGTRRLLEVVLRRWDLQNLIAMVRGIHQGWTPEEIGRWLWPVGRYDAPRLAELSRQTDIRQLADTLATWKDDFSGPLTEGALRYQNDRDIVSLEIGLMKHYYGRALRDLKGPGHSRSLLRSLLRQEIDRQNAKAASRLLARPGIGQPEALEHFIEGGQRLDRKTFLKLFDPRERKRAMAALRDLPFRDLLWPSTQARQAETELERDVSRQLGRLYRGDPLAADLAVGFLWQKYHEVSNLRLLARSKVFGPPADKLRPELTIFTSGG